MANKQVGLLMVPPAEVESVLLQHPGVAECGVVGAPDEAAGELPTAFVVAKPGAKITQQELLDFSASRVCFKRWGRKVLEWRLSPAKRLRGGIIFVNEIPKNGSGKILRRVLRQKLQEMHKIDECHNYRIQKTEYVKEEPDSECKDEPCETTSALLSNIVKDEPPPVMEQLQPMNITSYDYVGDGEVILKTDYVKEEPDSQCDRTVCEYRLTLLADLSKKIKNELDVTSPDSATSCANALGERALQQIVDGCFVKLERLKHQCSMCMNAFQTQSHLEAHNCNKRDAFESEKIPPKLNNNENSYDSLKLHYCNICHKELASQRTLERHKLNHSRSNVTCDICKRDFTNKYRLQLHMRTHLEEQTSKQTDSWKPIACDLCNKVFKYRSKLRIHRHSCAVWFTCNMCKKRFRNESDLIDHKKSHTDQKTFPCEYCDRQFDDCPSLLKHKKNHRRNPPVLCTRMSLKEALAELAPCGDVQPEKAPANRGKFDV
ncbi:hypothetical protein MSG28_014547 [Choristoneura fumiferana]|uniref:Uncharacterized protein n=1 Tax=Choristoneura fumiferana TaxID=7141 RepID=A0ACC0JRR5_CHOFU|nr:hypothetical protein MSG28_014547 [Choristoneura fumiferana]